MWDELFLLKSCPTLYIFRGCFYKYFISHIQTVKYWTTTVQMFVLYRNRIRETQCSSQLLNLCANRTTILSRKQNESYLIFEDIKWDNFHLLLLWFFFSIINECLHDELWWKTETKPLQALQGHFFKQIPRQIMKQSDVQLIKHNLAQYRDKVTGVTLLIKIERQNNQQQ